MASSAAYTLPISPSPSAIKQPHATRVVSRLPSNGPPSPGARTRTRGGVPEALARIQSSGIVACVRAPSGEIAVEAARAALSAGVEALEIVMPTPGALDAVRQLSKEFPSSAIGVGTVFDALAARGAMAAGARFLMSPATIADVLALLRDDGSALYIPGAATPTEVAAAYASGARMVKIFPATALGGAGYLAVLKKPFPHIPMIASQGVALESIEAYIGAGTSAVVLSDAILGADSAAARERDFDAIHRHASVAVSIGKRAAAKHYSPQPAENG